jgi:hypothetical protein
VTADLASYISELGLDEHREYLLDVARPSIQILTTKSPVTPGCSKFNGVPDLPAGFEWPHHALGTYRFFCQINLGELPDGPHGLPKNGLLSFFYAHDDRQEAMPWEPGYVLAYWFPDAGDLHPVEPPARVHLGATVVLAFRLGADVPLWPYDDETVATWPIQESLHTPYDELRSRLNPTGRYLLGYPPITTMAFDPTPGPERRLLLTVNSDDALWWGWLDGYELLMFIEESRLRTGDFSQIEATAC